MPNYTLYYWAAPFRGQFVRALLAYGGEPWLEAGDEATSALMEGALEDMPVPFMGPPVLVDHAAGVALSQMPAILLYLGDRLGLLPEDPGRRALSIKVVNDANDVIDDLTLDRGPMGGLCPAPAKMDGVVGGAGATPRPHASVRLPARRPCPGRGRHRQRDPLVDHVGALSGYRGDPRRCRAHDREPGPTRL